MKDREKDIEPTKRLIEAGSNIIGVSTGSGLITGGV